ncbi:MAG: M20 family metallo-hydrolase [Flavobacteriales bacterium]|nr:M20 family metallo-hydrolase [Flavobacteriales bacterium]
MSTNNIHKRAIDLLIELIKVPSYSRQEDKTADIIERFLNAESIPHRRIKNNFYARNKHYQEGKKNVLLNSHHDTVKAGTSWTYDPFGATIEGEKLIGLGSNDAGASLVSLISVFVELYNKELPYNLILGVVAEEEVSGQNGCRLLLSEIEKIDLGIVGEPTKMEMAIAEKGLIVLDCIAKGKTGHSARNEGINALYIALEDIAWFRSNPLKDVSDILGPCKMTVTQIKAGKQHNMIPDECHFVVDVRTNELYKNLEVIELVKQNIKSEITPRSYHLNSSRVDVNHPIVRRGKELGLPAYGSPTLSDQSVMDFETLKIGPGDSARSHTPDEYILFSEIEKGIDIYLELLKFTFD